MRSIAVVVSLIALCDAKSQSHSRGLRQLLDGMGDGISKTTYSANDPIPGLEFMLEYLTAESASDSCSDNLCTCDIDGTSYEVQQGRATLETSGSSGNGFGMHLVNCSMSSTGGQMSTSDVESQFNLKLGNMSSYDSFMDYNFALYTTDLDSYVSAFESGDVNYMSVQWTLASDEEGDDETTYYGIMVHVPNTQMVFEIMSETESSAHKDKSRIVQLEQRVSRKALERAKARMENNYSVSRADYLTVLAVSRATAKLDEVEAFYVDDMYTTKTVDVTTDDNVTRKCFLWESFGATADVCFTQRSPNATTGTFKVSDFETMLYNSHKNVIDSGSCYDKWMDNHYGLDNSGSASADFIVDYINDNDDAFYYCTSEGLSPGLHYFVDPTGWGIQVDSFEFSSLPKACESTMSKRKNPLPPPSVDDDKNDVCPCSFVTSCGYGDVTASDD